MPPSLRAAALACQPTAIDRVEQSRSTSVDHGGDSLGVLRQVVSDLGYTLDALQAAMRKDRSYIDKVLKGDKPMPADFIDALPDDVEAEWHSRRASSFGLFVVTPAATAEEATRALIVGMLGPRPQLPARADQMAKAALPIAAVRKVAR